MICFYLFTVAISPSSVFHLFSLITPDAADTSRHGYICLYPSLCPCLWLRTAHNIPFTFWFIRKPKQQNKVNHWNNLVQREREREREREQEEIGREGERENRKRGREHNRHSPTTRGRCGLEEGHFEKLVKWVSGVDLLFICGILNGVNSSSVLNVSRVKVLVWRPHESVRGDSGGSVGSGAVLRVPWLRSSPEQGMF